LSALRQKLFDKVNFRNIIHRLRNTSSINNSSLKFILQNVKSTLQYDYTMIAHLLEK